MAQTLPDLETWLKQNKLSKFIQPFEDEEIDLADLTAWNDSELEEYVVTPFGLSSLQKNRLKQGLSNLRPTSSKPLSSSLSFSQFQEKKRSFSKEETEINQQLQLEYRKGIEYQNELKKHIESIYSIETDLQKKLLAKFELLTNFIEDKKLEIKNESQKINIKTTNALKNELNMIEEYLKNIENLQNKISNNENKNENILAFNSFSKKNKLDLDSMMKKDINTMIVNSFQGGVGFVYAHAVGELLNLISKISNDKQLKKMQIEQEEEEEEEETNNENEDEKDELDTDVERWYDTNYLSLLSKAINDEKLRKLILSLAIKDYNMENEKDIMIQYTNENVFKTIGQMPMILNKFGGKKKKKKKKKKN